MSVLHTNTVASIPSPQQTERTLLMFERAAAVLLIATLVTIIQIVIAVTWAKHGEPISVKYFSLNNFDSQWYAHIANVGYQLQSLPLETKGNIVAQIGFFPGYPIFVSALKKLTGIGTALSLLLTAQIFTVGVWIYILLFFRRYHVRWKIQVAGILTIVSFPSAFFLVCGYSESLFIFSLLGYLYWMTHEHPKAWIPASIHGFLMSATRIVGIPLLVLPLVRDWLMHRKFCLPATSCAIALFTGLGASLFFLYCQSRFGEWNIYSHAQFHGWRVTPNFSAIFDPSIYRMVMPAISWDGFVNPDDLSRLSVPLIFALACLIFVAVVIAIIKNPRDTSRIDHSIFCLAAGCLLFVTITGLETVRMRSVIRYMLPSFILLVIVAASLFSKHGHWKGWNKRLLWSVLSAAIAILFYIEVGYIDLYSYGVWVA